MFLNRTLRATPSDSTIAPIIFTKPTTTAISILSKFSASTSTMIGSESTIASIISGRLSTKPSMKALNDSGSLARSRNSLTNWPAPGRNVSPIKAPSSPVKA